MCSRQFLQLFFKDTIIESNETTWGAGSLLERVTQAEWDPQGVKYGSLKIYLTAWRGVSSTMHVLGSAQPIRAHVPSPLTAHQGVHAGERHTCWVTGAQRQSCTATCPCGQAVQHKARSHRFPTYWHCMNWVWVYAPNVSLSLDIATSASTDKDLFVRLRSFSEGMTGGNWGLI